MNEDDGARNPEHSGEAPRNTDVRNILDGLSAEIIERLRDASPAEFNEVIREKRGEAVGEEAVEKTVSVEREGAPQDTLAKIAEWLHVSADSQEAKDLLLAVKTQQYRYWKKGMRDWDKRNAQGGPQLAMPANFESGLQQAQAELEDAEYRRDRELMAIDAQISQLMRGGVKDNSPRTGAGASQEHRIRFATQEQSGERSDRVQHQRDISALSESDRMLRRQLMMRRAAIRRGRRNHADGLRAERARIFSEQEARLDLFYRTHPEEMPENRQEELESRGVHPDIDKRDWRHIRQVVPGRREFNTAGEEEQNPLPPKPPEEEQAPLPPKPPEEEQAPLPPKPPEEEQTPLPERERLREIPRIDFGAYPELFAQRKGVFSGKHIREALEAETPHVVEKMMEFALRRAVEFRAQHPEMSPEDFKAQYLLNFQEAERQLSAACDERMNNGTLIRRFGHIMDESRKKWAEASTGGKVMKVIKGVLLGAGVVGAGILTFGLATGAVGIAGMSIGVGTAIGAVKGGGIAALMSRTGSRGSEHHNIMKDENGAEIGLQELTERVRAAGGNANVQDIDIAQYIMNQYNAAAETNVAKNRRQTILKTALGSGVGAVVGSIDWAHPVQSQEPRYVMERQVNQINTGGGTEMVPNAPPVIPSHTIQPGELTGQVINNTLNQMGISGNFVNPDGSTNLDALYSIIPPDQWETTQALLNGTHSIAGADSLSNDGIRGIIEAVVNAHDWGSTAVTAPDNFINTFTDVPIQSGYNTVTSMAPDILSKIIAMASAGALTGFVSSFMSGNRNNASRPTTQNNGEATTQNETPPPPPAGGSENRGGTPLAPVGGEPTPTTPPAVAETQPQTARETLSPENLQNARNIINANIEQIKNDVWDTPPDRISGEVVNRLREAVGDENAQNDARIQERIARLGYAIEIEKGMTEMRESDRDQFDAMMARGAFKPFDENLGRVELSEEGWNALNNIPFSGNLSPEEIARRMNGGYNYPLDEAIRAAERIRDGENPPTNPA